MTAPRLWVELFERGVILRARGDKLSIDAPRGAVDRALKARLQQDKAALMDWLSQPKLSFAQERMWFLQQLMPGSGAYNVPLVFRLRGALDHGLVARSLSALVARHDILRTSYPSREGRPIAVTSEATEQELLSVSCASDEQLDRAVRDLVEAPFDLAAGPPIRHGVFARGPVDHVLAICTHHIACDGWSAQLLFGEFTALYAHDADPVAAGLSAPSLRYSDLARYERARLELGRLDESRRYWIDELRGVSETARLPPDRRRPATLSMRGETHEHRLSNATTDAVKAASRAAKVTPFVFLLSAFAEVVRRFAGGADVVVGTAVSNRQAPGSERLVGTLTNNVVFRVDVSRPQTFAELVAHVYGKAISAYEHQAYPFEKLVQELGVARDRSQNPVFQLMFMQQNAPRSAQELPGLQVSAFPLPRQTARLDLSVQAHEEDGHYVFRLEYSTDLFLASTIRRIAEHLDRLLAQAAATPDRPKAGLTVMSDEERREVTQRLARGPRRSRPSSVVAWLREVVARHGSRPAVLTRETSTSFDELWSAAGRVAAGLTTRAAVTERPVAICLDRGLSYVTAILGCLRANIPFLPIDPSYPDPRINYVLADSRARLAIVGGAQQARLEALDVAVEVVTPDDLDATVFHVDTERAEPPPHRLAYVIYTSGSTGEPKGVLLEHKGITNLVQAQIDVFGLGVGDRALQFAGLGFDAVISEIFTTLCAGGTLCMPSSPDDMVGEGLADLLEDLAINVVTLPPSTASVLPERAYPALRTLICAGEASPPELVERWSRRHRFVNAYGPTEGTVCATMFPCDRVARPTPIGHVIDNASAYVLDDALRPVPIGVWGQLHLAGIGLARGYLGKPGLTAERFIPDPFAEEAGARMYRSGDVARWNADGVLEFRGRLDDQVKVRGYRIELGEVENALRRLEGVDDAAAVTLGEGPSRRLAAFVVGSSDVVGPAALRDELARNLPGYLVPSVIRVVERLPMTPNGKVDKRALSRARVEVERPPSREPSDELEEALLVTVRELLEEPSLGVEDDFFAAGGQSLLAARLVATVRADHGTAVPLSTFMAEPTIAALAAYLRAPRVERAGPLVTLAGTAGAPVVVLVAALGGTLAPYGALVERLRDRACVYGLVPEDGQGLIDPALPATVEAYRKGLVGLDGPFTLVGWSLGGLVAQALAASLGPARVTQTVLVDSWFDDGATAREGAVLAELAGMVSSLGLAVGGRPEDILAAAQAAGLLPGDDDRDLLDWVTRQAALRETFRPATSDVPIALAHATESADAPSREAARQRWSLAASLSCYRAFPGRHAELLRAPTVQALADWIAEVALTR
jgi:amino acid adenylation domain-containing protein